LSDNKLYIIARAWFLSEDPIGLAAGINTYTFAGNDPINFRDPTGMEPDADDEEDEHDHSNFYCENGGVYDIDFGQCWGWDGHLHDPSDPSGMAPDWAFHTNGIIQLAELVGRIVLGGTKVGYMEEDGVLVTVYENPNLPGGTLGMTMGNSIWVYDVNDVRIVHHEMTHVHQQHRGWVVGMWISYGLESIRHGYYCNRFEVEAYASHGENRCPR